MSFLEIYYSKMLILFLFITDMMLSASRLLSVCKICDSNGRTFAVLRTQMRTSQNLDPRCPVRQTAFKFARATLLRSARATLQVCACNTLQVCACNTTCDPQIILRPCSKTPVRSANRGWRF